MRIVRRSPIFTEPTHVEMGQEVLLVRPYQIVLWVRLEVRDVLTNPFPAILDTGFSLNFSIDQGQLERWTGLKTASLKVIGRTKINQQKLPLHQAGLALERNVNCERDKLRGEPYKLTLKEGITIYSTGGPRLPLIGLRALMQNKLKTTIDERSVTIRRKWFS